MNISGIPVYISDEPDLIPSGSHGAPHFGSLDKYNMRLSIDDLRRMLKEAIPTNSWWKDTEKNLFIQVINACVRDDDAELFGVLYCYKGSPDVVFCVGQQKWLERVERGAYVPVEEPK